MAKVKFSVKEYDKFLSKNFVAPDCVWAFCLVCQDIVQIKVNDVNHKLNQFAQVTHLNLN